MNFHQYRLTKDRTGGPSALVSGKGLGRRREPFIKGPIPLSWLLAAADLAGAASMVGTILWYLGGLKRSMTFKIGIQDIAARLNRSWITVQRAISALERANLIKIERSPGRKNIVTILEVEEEKGGESKGRV